VMEVMELQLGVVLVPACSTATSFRLSTVQCQY
jgi:hypothetical protein